MSYLNSPNTVHTFSSHLKNQQLVLIKLIKSYNKRYKYIYILLKALYDMELLLRSRNREVSLDGSSESMQLASYQINKQFQTNIKNIKNCEIHYIYLIKLLTMTIQYYR